MVSPLTSPCFKAILSFERLISFTLSSIELPTARTGHRK